LKENIFKHRHSFELESGETLPEIEIAYTTLGNLQRDEKGKCTNVIWICHALTANAEVADWWSGLVGEGKLYDPQKYFIICANMLGSCYGSTNALSISPITKEPYYYDFPMITVRDMVKALELLRLSLEINQIYLCTGGSMGGQQAIEWAILKPNLIENLILLATNAQHSPWGIAFNESQRMAIQSDALWGQKTPKAGLEGMKVARSMALLSYRNYEAYQITQSEQDIERIKDYKAASYQRYQGEKLAKRFNAFSYFTLSKAMDSHHVGRGRTSTKQALAQIKANTIVIGINSDGLFPIEEQRFLAENIRESTLYEIDSPFGHDGFLIEFEKIEELILSQLLALKLVS